MTAAIAVGRASIATTATNTTVGFTLLGLLTSIGFLFVNALAVFSTLSSLPTPEIKTVVVNGLEDGPMKVYLNMEFPGTKNGHLISAKTEGPLKLSAYISEKGKAAPKEPSLSVKIPDGIELNLASTTPTNLAIDDLQIDLNENFDASILSRIVGAQLDKTFDPKMLPNMKIKLQCRVVLKSLWIPLGASLDLPYTVDLTKIMKKKLEDDEKRAKEEKKKAEEENKKAEEAAKEGKPLPVKELTPKELALKNFDYKPRSVRVSASDTEKLEIVAIGAFPAALVPDFLTVQVPEISIQAGLFELGTPGEIKPERMIQVNVKPFLVHPVSNNDFSEEILVEVTVLIDEHDAAGVQKLLEMARDGQKDKIGVRIKQQDEFISSKKAGGLMFWFRDFILDVPVGEMIVEAEKKKKEGPSVSESAAEAAAKLLENAQNSVKNQIMSAKLLKTAKLKNGGSFIFQIRILRSFASFFVGKLPEIKLKGRLLDNTSLVMFKLSSNEITKSSDSIDIDIEVGVKNLREAVYTGLLVSKMGTEELHKKIPEIRHIEGMKFSFTSENIISKLARVFDVDVMFDKNGLKSVKFAGSEALLYPKAVESEDVPETKTENATEEATSTPAENASTETTTESNTTPEKKKKMMEVSAKFAIENEKQKVFGEQSENLHIGASIDLTEIPYIGDYAHLSWEMFTLKVNYHKASILIFKIHPGAVSVGITGGITPFYANFATGITVPATMRELNNLQKFLKAFMDEEDAAIDLDFEINYEHEANGKPDDVLLSATIPCKQLLLGKPVEPVKPIEPVEAAKTEPTEPVVESVKPTDESVKTESAETTKSDGTAITDAKPADKPETETDFIGKVKNSVISFVSFQAATLFFHVTYPNGHYCTKASSDFDLKINVDVALPTVEANVCAKEDERGALKCFASAGISRPMKLSAQIIDGKVCHVESFILPQEYDLAGMKTIKSSTDFKYNSNEIPVHVSIRDLPALVRFGEMAAGKRKQFLTIGPVDEATSLNKFIGVIVSSMFSIEYPPKEVPKTPEELKKAEEEKKAAASKVLTIPYAPESPAVLEVGGSSKNNNELEILLGFHLPKSALEGIAMVSAFENNFNWPALQWGMFDYTVGIEGVFEASISLKRGQIDLHEDGVVFSALQDFALRIKVKTNENIKLGSTALRQILGNLKNHFFRGTDKERSFDAAFLRDIQDNKFYYKFTMNGPRGLNDPSVFFANGDVAVKELIDLGDALIHRQPLPDLPNSGSKPEVKADGEESATAEPAKKDLFGNKKITMKTVSKYGQEQPAFVIPCLVPALCKESFNTEAHADEIKNKGGPIELIFELENILLPVTELIGGQLGPVLRSFKMKNYPSNLELKCTVLSEVWLTLVLDGAGLMSFGLSPFEFSRKALIDYGSDQVINLLPSQRSQVYDMFNLPIKLDFPDTLVGLRSSLAIFRRESLLLPPVAPVYFSERTDGTKDFKELTIAPFYMALSSDDRVHPGRNNLISALMAAVVPEFVLPAMNPDDQLLDMINDKYEYPNAMKPVVEEKKEEEVKKKDKEESAMGPLDMAKLGKIVFCLATGFYCDTQLDVIYNVKMPFGVDMLRFILPSTTILRLYVAQAAVFQYVADARHQRPLEISSEKGLTVLGTANINFTGLDALNTPKIEDVKAALWSEDLTPLQLRVIMGRDVDLTAELHFPFKLLSAMAKRQSVKFAEQREKLRKTLNLADSWSHYISNAVSKVTKAIIPTIKPSESGPVLTEEQLKQFRPERRECLDGKLNDVDKNDRLHDLNFENTAIFYEKGKEVFSAGPGQGTLYLQLRTSKEEVVCGQPASTKNLQVLFIRDEKTQGFIKLVNLFSYNRPNQDELEVFAAATTVFDHALNLFVVKVSLPHAGRYQVKLKYGNKAEYIPNAFVYVKNDY